MMSITITFNGHGIGHCFYTEAINLATLGKLDIARVTTIEWDRASQLWHVRNTESLLLFSASSRAECITWEQKHFNH